MNPAVTSFKTTIILEYSALLETPYRKRSKVGVDVMSKTLADQIVPKELLSFSRKRLKWIDGKIAKNKGGGGRLYIAWATNSTSIA